MDIRPDLMPDAATYMHIVGGFGFFQAVSFYDIGGAPCGEQAELRDAGDLADQCIECVWKLCVDIWPFWFPLPSVYKERLSLPLFAGEWR